MGRKKYKKITEVRSFLNVFDYKNENAEAGIKNFFSNGKPITIELCCGQADYSIGLAEHYPERNFLGIDRKPNRLWNASKNANERNTKNVALLIAYIERLDETLKDIKAEEIWITFPDPYPFQSSIKKRLTHPRFLAIYKKILTENGKINLKTDDDTLYEYTLQMIDEMKLKTNFVHNDIYSLEQITFEYTIKTKYEKMHLEKGKKIKLVSFSFGHSESASGG
ncbi:MAG: tRNA (guanine-N(7))-methyltransferase [Ignavibacteria bacterium]|nr:MAG: tRNA (guanine-N(7))-methyltransferase [Ignavibacteria bacterium]KAF0158883.1 MAG: tRNA (guanine-N(7))-methyltransferase [Ignavibacteria bacterium]